MKSSGIILMLVLAGATPALAQFAVRGTDTANGAGMLTGNNFRAFATVGQPLSGRAGNADFAVGFGLGAQPDVGVPTNVEGRPADDEVPGTYRLDQNYPNPFNPQTTITYALPEPTPVRIELFNVMGQRVQLLVDQEQSAGQYHVLWDGRNVDGRAVASGVYLYRITTPRFTQTRTMLLLK